MLRLFLIYFQLSLLALFSASSALSAQMLEEVPMTLSGQGKLYSKVNVDGLGEHSFLLDTGATNTVITEHLAKLLSLWKYPDRESRSVTANMARMTDIYFIGDLFIDEYKFNAIRAGALSGGETAAFKGILGGNLWKDVVAEFDIDELKFRLYDEDHQFKEEDGWQRIDGIGYMRPFLIIPIVLEGREMRAIIDTGANRTIINPRAAALLGVHGTSRQAGTSVITDGSEKSVEAIRFTSTYIKIGEHKISAMDLYAADLFLFKELNVNFEPTIILGMDILQHFNIAVDMADSILYLQNRDGLYTIYR